MSAVNLILAGAARSGTTALAAALDQHPDITLSAPKEVHFFAHAEQPLTYRGPGDERMLNRSLITDPAVFARLFDNDPAPVRAEGSVSTLAFPDRSIPAIKQFASPDATIVVLLREPAARARSSFQYLRARGYEPMEAFADGLAAEQERIAGGYHHMWQYRTLSRYDEQLPAFAEAFGDRLILGIFEEERADLRPFVRRICMAVGVDPTFDFQTDREINRGGEPRSRIVTEVIRRIADEPRAAAAAKALVPRTLRERIRHSNIRTTSGDHELMEELRREFRPAVAAAEAVIGRPIPEWSAQ